MILAPVAAIGRSTLAGLAALGRIAIFLVATIAAMLRPPFYFREFL
ncbi:MAG TPA: ABC transporter permease, partial [Rhodovulum sp.]|nr:ABC transporter permease [Rhodovulum sp.]